MKIKDLVESVGVVLTNEEKNFVYEHGDSIRLTSLDEHETWIAQNLVRKGIYEISNDDSQLVKAKHVFYIRSRT